VNDAWTFDTRAARLWVTAAGGVVEVILGSACVILWALTEDGTTIHGIAYLVFMISLSFSLFMNLNPLMKFDGYYLFADLVRVENLRERSFAQVGWLLRSKVFRLQAPRVSAGGREAWILAAYGISAMLYMGLMITGLLALLWGAAFGEGRGPGPLMLLFFAWICWMMLQRPLRAVGGIVSETVKPRMERMGPRAFWGRCGAGAAGLMVISMFVPWTRVSSAAGTAEPGRIRDVRSPLEGVVAEVLVAEGARVAEGDALVRVDAPEEEARARMERERAGRLRRDVQGRRAAGDAAGAGSLEKQAEAAEVAAADSEARLAQRTVSSPGAGIVLTRRIGESRGLPVHRETGLLRVGDCSRIRFRCIMDASAVAPVREGMEARVRLEPFPGSPLPGKVVAVSRQPLDEKDSRLKEVTGPHWEVLVEADSGGLAVLPGMTGVASVVIERTTLAATVARGLRETVRSDLLR
jgi:putative peptide zinc metalloprotease protein